MFSLKEQRRSSIIRHSTPNNPRECETTMTARFSSDFSSIAPSQSASQVTLNHDHEEEPLSEPVGVHSVTNAADPVSPSIATMTAAAAPAPAPAPEPEPEPIVESNTARPRPPSGNSTTTTTGSSIRYSLSMPATYTFETVTYAQAIPVHVGGSGTVVTKDSEREREQDKGKARENSPRPRNSSSSVSRSGSPYVPISYRDEDLLTTMRIPAPHAIEGYAPGIPTAGPSSGDNHFGGCSTPRSRPSSGVGMPQLQPQPSLQLQPSNLDNGKRHKLDKKITEEELRKRSEEVGAEDEVSSIEEVKARKKLVKEGKIEVVENPRFMTEARKKELERERLREAATSTSTPVAKEEKKKFSFFPNPHLRRNESEGHAAPANQQPVVEHKEEQEREAATEASAAPPPSEDGSPPSKLIGSTPKYTGSPSRGWFISGLKGFFGPRPPSTPQNSPTRQRSTKTKTNANNTTTTITAVFNNRPLPSGHDSDAEDDSPPKPKGLQALFGRSPTKHKTTKSGGEWKTRTDDNLREIRSERRGNSFDGVVPPRRSGIAGGAVKDVGVVRPAAAGSGSVTDLGAGSGGSGQGPQRRRSSTRGRAVSDVGTSSRPTPAATPGGRKLRKPRTGGPPVSASAAVAAAGENWSTVSVASSSSIGPSAPVPLAAAPFPAAATTQPRPRTPIRAVSTSAIMGDAGKIGSRRSASVDVNRRSRADPEDEGELIVDLGSRRRTRSDAGAAKEKAKDKVPPMPTDPPMIRTASSKEYSGDTAMVRNDSTRKAHTQASVDPAIQHPVSSTSTSTPSRKASIKSPSTSTPSKSPGISSISGGTTPAVHATATVLPAGGENPSGTLVAYPGWDAQAHAQAQGGSLSRHTSFSSSAASPSAAGKPTLGQGVGRKLSVGSAPVKTSTAAQATVKRDVDAVAPRPAVPSLMSIVEDVSRSNRGWTEELKMRKSVGGSRTATANLLDGMLVRAPPPVPRSALEEMLGSRSGGTGGSPAASTVGFGGKPSSLSSSKGTGLFEAKAPGSVFDHRHEMAAALTTPPSKATPAATSTIPAKPQKQTPAEAGVGVERRSSVRKVEATTTSTPSSASAPVVKGKSPLRSAMRSTSSSPSPMATAAGPSQIQHSEGRAPLSNGLAVGAHGAQQQQQQPKATQERKDKAAPTPARRDSKTSGGEGDGDSVSTVFYSDQGTSEAEGEKGVVMNGSAVPTTVNGLEHGVRKQQSGSEISHSTVSTVVGGLSGQQQQQQHQTPVSSQQSQAESSQTSPRRRKSVRVSLKPTFSPSPPAIEYDYEEEHQRYAAWGRRHENEHERAEEERRGHSPSRPPPPLHPHPPLHPQTAVVAPTPVRAAPVQHRLVGSGGVGDMWDDSGEDEDEDYATAKRMLARAAKKEKDTKLMIAKGRV